MQRNEEVFRSLCRVKGTRCNAIMGMIEKGITDDRIAKRFHTSTNTIRVYRNALLNKLTEGCYRPSQEAGIKAVSTGRQEQIIKDYQAGMTEKRLAIKWGYKEQLIKTIIQKARNRGDSMRGRMGAEDDPRVEVALAMYDQGYSHREIADVSRLELGQVRYQIRKHRPHGRPRKT